ncbi:MAG: bacteriohemerythrin [Sterolibacterium sp.]
MQPFAWNKRFETGIAVIDEQHHLLVGLINRVSDLLIKGGDVDEELPQIVSELKDYVGFHFATEEDLMAASGIDRRHFELHRKHHRHFVEQLEQMWAMHAMQEQPVEILEDFLSSWLTYHILGEDQSTARQLALIAGGMTADTAWQHEQQPTDNSMAVLLKALRQLYHVLSLQNQGLVQSNLHLEQRVAERTQELLQASKMAAVGQLAAGVAHEINNPIGFVNSNLGTLGRYVEQLLMMIDAYADCEAKNLPVSPRLAEINAETNLAFLREDLAALLRESQEGLDRIKKIVQDLKDFSHANAVEMQDADLVAGIESTLSVAWSELKYKAEVIRELPPQLPLRCIPGQINQVVMNLLVNAAQAIEARGRIVIRAGEASRDGSRWVWFEVEDSGCGMRTEVKQRIFEPFYTTKPVGTGTGLGLSVSWDIVVNHHHGRIEVDSEPGKGSTFRVWLPAAGC